MKGDLKKAEKMYLRRRYPQVIRILEPQIFRFRQNYDFFYLVGMSCLHTGDLGGASTYLQRGLGLKPNDTKANLGLALVHLKRQDAQEAIRCYLEVMDNDPGNRRAKLGLALLQKDASPERLADLSESGRLGRLAPDKRRRPGKYIAILLIVVACFAAAVFLLKYTTLFDRETEVRQTEVQMLSIDDISNVVDLRGEYRYVLTKKQIERAFSSAKKYFGNFRDNLAQKEINLLLGSNASPEVKEQSRTIASYVVQPDFTTLRDPFSYQEVAADPFLYSQTYVAWKGKISNLFVGEDSITFDLLVGYETSEVLLGVVPVTLSFAVLLDQGDPVEILGQILLDDSGGFSLKVISLHKLTLPEDD